MIIAIGSKNPSKIKAVEKVFKKFFGKTVIKSVEVRLSVPPQPLKLIDTIKGAVERAYKSLLEVKGAEFGVGIEAGLTRIPYTISGYFDFQLCSIVDRSLKVTIGSSSAFEFPPQVIRKVVRGEVTESEEVFEEITGIKNIGNKIGAIGYLSKGYVEREELSTQAVISALIPRLNKELYIGKWPNVFEILKIE